MPTRSSKKDEIIEQIRRSARPLTRHRVRGSRLKEFKEGKLRSSSGDKVTSKKQAMAIALSKAGRKRRSK